MMKAFKLTAFGLLVFSLIGCETTNNRINSSIQELQGQPPIEVTESIELSPGTMAGAAALALLGVPSSALGLPSNVISRTNAAILYLIYDPLAPNWNIKEKQLSEDVFYVSMRAKSFRIGGDGESMQILKRRARQVQLEKSYTGFRILDYSEGIESSTPLTHRVSEGIFQLVKDSSQGPVVK